jgi:hypothetical protein
MLFGTPNASDFSSIASKLLQVLAGSLLDRSRLVSPRWTGARIDTSVVSQNIRLHCSAFDLNAISVFDISHNSSPLIERYWANEFWVGVPTVMKLL